MMIPTWITPESWQAFEEMRKKTCKAPLTIYAAKLVVMELVRLKGAGEDPQACLDQSIRNGWRDVFPVRDKALRVNTVSPEVEKRHKDAYEKHLAASIAAMRK
jgi:hypothetical protein